MSDGLTVLFGLAAGLSGAMVTAGLTEITAGSIGMGLGGYLAAKSDAAHYLRTREESEISEKADMKQAKLLRFPILWSDSPRRL